MTGGSNHEELNWYVAFNGGNAQELRNLLLEVGSRSRLNWAYRADAGDSLLPLLSHIDLPSTRVYVSEGKPGKASFG